MPMKNNLIMNLDRIETDFPKHTIHAARCQYPLQMDKKSFSVPYVINWKVDRMHFTQNNQVYLKPMQNNLSGREHFKLDKHKKG